MKKKVVKNPMKNANRFSIMPQTHNEEREKKNDKYKSENEEEENRTSLCMSANKLKHSGFHMNKQNVNQNKIVVPEKEKRQNYCVMPNII